MFSPGNPGCPITHLKLRHKYKVSKQRQRRNGTEVSKTHARRLLLGQRQDNCVRHSKDGKLDQSVFSTQTLPLVFMQVTDKTSMLCYVHKPPIHLGAQDLSFRESNQTISSHTGLQTFKTLDACWVLHKWKFI